ncbi:MAG: PepSY domain-containing protein [Nocardioidaceae bacterium]|nr:PepSY domain-containing protein [Nocardioidaceae bacterium]
MDRKKLIVGAAGAVTVATLLGGGIAIASSTGDDGEGNVSGPDADKATAAALRATGGGEANSVELDSENGATWEVEVTRPDGNTVDVRLDDNFEVVVIEGDSEESEGSGD